MIFSFSWAAEFHEFDWLGFIDVHPRQRGFVVAEVPEIGEDAAPGGCESRIGIA